MPFVITNDPATQLVISGELGGGGGGDTLIVEPIMGEVRAVDEVTANLDCVILTDVAPGAFQILTFATSTPTQEIGATVIAPAFTASYSTPPAAATLTDNDGNPPKNVTSTPTAFTSNGAFAKTVNNASVSFTLQADLAAESDSAGASIAWRPRTYWGIGGAALLTEAQIEALANSQLDNNFAAVFSPNAPGAGDYVWYCFPQSYDPTDAAQFQVGPFIGGFTKMGVVSVTNVHGVTQNYACWRSDFPQLGSFTLTVL